MEEGNPKQLWKKVGNHLISRYNGAILGAHETEGLVVISRGETDTVVPVSINEDATTSFEFSVPGTGTPLLRRFLLGWISNYDGFSDTEKPSYILIWTVFS